MTKLNLVTIALLLLLPLPVIAGAQMMGGSTTARAAATAPGKKAAQTAVATPNRLIHTRTIAIKFNAVPLKEAIAQVAKLGKITYAIAEPLPENMRVTLEISDPGMEAFAALRLVCSTAGLQVKPVTGTPDSVIISAPPSLNHRTGLFPPSGNTGVSSFIALPPGITSLPTWEDNNGMFDYGQSMMGDSANYFFRGGYDSGLGNINSATGTVNFYSPNWPVIRTAFNGSDRLVDLQIKDAPLEAAVKELFKNSNTSIVVDPSVPKGIKVTARVFKMPLSDVLTMLVNQAGLIFTVESRSDEQSSEYIAAKEQTQAMLKAAEEKLKTAQRLLEMTEQRVNAGVASATERENARNDVNQAELDLANAKLSAVTQLDHARAAKRMTIIHIVPPPEMSVTPSQASGANSSSFSPAGYGNSFSAAIFSGAKTTGRATAPGSHK
jgi:hypothetical protein